MTPFIYDEDIPAALLPEIQKAIEPWAWIVPAWCERVFVGYSDDSDSASDGTAADCLVEYPYRWARITFKPRFLTEDKTHCPHGLHELLHISVGPISNWIRETIKILCREGEAPKFHETLMTEMRERVESTVEDIARRIFEHSKITIP